PVKNRKGIRRIIPENTEIKVVIGKIRIRRIKVKEHGGASPLACLGSRRHSSQPRLPLLAWDLPHRSALNPLKPAKIGFFALCIIPAPIMPYFVV
ncbi:hypothetical protein IJJ12_00250, partial [bacterium]|nr:hypothetical protein [bacterium]